MKKNIKKIIAYLLFITIISLVISFFSNNYKSGLASLTSILFDKIFLVNLLIFIITGIVFINSQGTFNIFKYSTKHYRATLSKRYRHRLEQEYSLKTKQEIKEFLKEKYLYAPKKHSSTTIYFYCSIIILIFYILFINL